MSPLPIGNNNNPPLNNINGSVVNIDNSHTQGIPFTNTKIPAGPHTLAPAGSNVQGAAGIYPCAQNGGKINRSKINKISRKYKMKGSKRTIKNRVKKIKSKIRSKYARKHSRRHTKRAHKKRHIKGGSSNFLPPMKTPDYPAGYSQYQNNAIVSNTYSTGGPLTAADSALASPPPFKTLPGNVDNLNHATLNAYGKIGAGSGFLSRGSF